jgi:lipid-A-disaccharide synthase-like uncharacterized protein
MDGLGHSVLPIVFVTSLVVGGGLQVLLEAIGRPDLTFLAFSLGLFAAAAANWVIGRRMNGRPPR